MEERYWELRENVDRAFDKWCATVNVDDYEAFIVAKQNFEGYCVDVLTQLMEENSDVLNRLKDA